MDSSHGSTILSDVLAFAGPLALFLPPALLLARNEVGVRRRLAQLGVGFLICFMVIGLWVFGQYRIGSRPGNPHIIPLALGAVLILVALAWAVWRPVPMGTDAGRERSADSGL